MPPPSPLSSRPRGHRASAAFVLVLCLPFGALFTTETVVMNERLAAIYGVEHSGTELTVVDGAELPGRRGVLSTPALAYTPLHEAHASIVKRGVFVMETLLCREAPPPPPDADDELPERTESGATDQRSILAESHLANDSCKGCHAAFDPLGYPFENLDVFGRYVEEDEHGNPLSSDGEWRAGDETLPYANLEEFVGILAAHEQLQHCAVEHAFVFGVARPFERADRCELEALSQSFEESGYDYRALMLAIATSTDFRYVAGTGTE